MEGREEPKTREEKKVLQVSSEEAWGGKDKALSPGSS